MILFQKRFKIVTATLQSGCSATNLEAWLDLFPMRNEKTVQDALDWINEHGKAGDVFRVCDLSNEARNPPDVNCTGPDLQYGRRYWVYELTERIVKTKHLTTFEGD